MSVYEVRDQINKHMNHFDLTKPCLPFNRTLYSTVQKKQYFVGIAVRNRLFILNSIQQNNDWQQQESTTRNINSVFGKGLRDEQRENERSVRVDFDGRGGRLNLAPRNGFIWSRAGIGSIKLLQRVL